MRMMSHGLLRELLNTEAAPAASPSAPAAPPVAVAEPAAPVAEPAAAAPAAEPAPPAVSTAQPPAAYAPGPGGVSFTSFDDDTIKTGDFEYYKGVKGRIDRIAVLNPKQIAFGRYHYGPEGSQLGSFVCLSEWTRKGGQDVCVKRAICCEKLGDPRKRFAVLVAHFNTNPKGDLVAPLSFVLKAWRISDDKFVQIRSIDAEQPLLQHDLKVECTDEQYQKMNIFPCREAVFANEKVKAVHGEEVNGFVEASLQRIDKALGTTRTASELASKLAGGIPAAGASATASEGGIADISDLLG
jgi:hypothetical protein